MDVLIIKPIGGLANRIRAIEAACSYANKHSSIVKVVWEKNNILNSSYNECFQPIEGVKVINVDYSGYTFLSKIKRFFFGALNRSLLYMRLIKKMNDRLVGNILDGDVKSERSDIFFDHLAQLHRKIYIETCYEFYSISPSFLVKINKDIQEQAQSIIKNFDYLVGIHIRRTDNFVATENSPLELYVEKMDAELLRHPHVIFYVSTDADEILKALKEKYRNKIITGALERRRDTKRGILSALIDLYCLSKCHKIWGSVYSSFSKQASKIGNVPLEIISKKGMY